ncbi:MAG: 30S ribosomal protein S16 [Candidatus Saccharimonadales bacterium]
MLAIRLQRTGRKGHAQFRIVVQDSRRSPTSGRFVFLLGNYDPHSKALNLNKEKAEYYLANGARPSDRVARLLKNEGIKLPSWVQLEVKQSAKIRNPEKLRKNQPAKPVEEPVVEPAAEPTVEAPAEVVETPAEAEPTPKEEPAE